MERSDVKKEEEEKEEEEEERKKNKTLPAEPVAIPQAPAVVIISKINVTEFRHPCLTASIFIVSMSCASFA